MATKQKPVFESAKEELSYLRKQNHGLKGQIGLLQSQKKDLDKCVNNLRDDILKKDGIIDGLESQVVSLNEKINSLVARVDSLLSVNTHMTNEIERHNGLSWFDRIFNSKIEVSVKEQCK